MAERTVADPSDVQRAMVDCSQVVRTLVAGTKAMRAAGTTYLPQEPAESKKAYDNRVLRSTLFNATGKTVDDMAGKVFNKPVILKEDVPEILQQYCEDIDLTGRHLNVFARDVFHDVLQTGIGYILTDMPPKVQRADGKPATITDEKQAGMRPYLVYIPLEKLLGWKSQRIGGVETLTQVRIKECVTEPSDEFHEYDVVQIRVIDSAANGQPGTWRIYRETKDDKNQVEWTLYEAGVYPLPQITLVPVYANGTGFMTGAPPFLKLAELNISHWQSSSDQRNILHVARVPILFGAGFEPDDKFEIGADSMVRSSKVDAKLSYVEHSGAAIGSGQADLDKLELQMQAMGLQLLISTPGQTATGEIRDDVKENSPLAMMARGLEDALESSLGFMAELIGLGEDAGGEVEVNKDFGVQGAASLDIPNIIAANTSGLLDKQTALEELKRRNFLADSVDPEEVIAKAETEAAAAMLDAGPGKGMNLNGDPANSQQPATK